MKNMTMDDWGRRVEIPIDDLLTEDTLREIEEWGRIAGALGQAWRRQFEKMWEEAGGAPDEIPEIEILMGHMAGPGCMQVEKRMKG